MQESDVRKFAEAHGKSIVTGDQASLMADFVPDMLPKLGAVAGSMPQPVQSAEVQSVALSGEEAVVRILYTGADKSVTVESRWAERDGRPKIIGAELVS
jgi:hypothetical protein